jgi:hypothetical protein
MGWRLSWFRRRYGDGPAHLLLTTACLAFGGYLVRTVVPAANSVRILIWIGVAAAVHDLVLWPLYVILDRALTALHRRGAPAVPEVPWINHVRAPVVLSSVALLISFPLVLRHSEPAYHTATGLSEHPYLGRWLWLTGCAFGLSAALYVARVLRRRLRARSHAMTPPVHR